MCKEIINIEYNYKCLIAIIETIQQWRKNSNTSVQTNSFLLI